MTNPFGGPEPSGPQANPYDPTGTPGYQGNPAGMSPDERTWGMLAHLAALSGLVVPFGNFIGPLVVWLIKREEMPFVDDQGKESLNFQITMTIAALVVGILLCVVVGFILLPLIAIYPVVMVIIASVRTSKGERYRYPLTLRLIT